MPTSSGVDPAKMRETVRLLRGAGYMSMADTLEMDWGVRPNTASLSKNAKKKRTSLQPKSRESSKARGGSMTSPNSSAALTPPRPLSVTAQKRLVMTCIGDPDDMWTEEPDPTSSSAVFAPFFEHGAGLPRDDFIEELGHPVSFVSVRPYKKQPPPSDLPWQQFALSVFYQAGRTGLEAEDELRVQKGDIIASRYRVEAPLDAATFSHTVKAEDTATGQLVCLKVIRNLKSYFDQGLDELRVLTCVNEAGCADACCVVRLLDYSYFRNHLILVTELLSSNLYEHARCLDEAQRRAYFTLGNLQRIARQVLTALKLMHSLQLIHCDIKPENIAFRSVPKCEVKVLDLGSSCYLTDTLSSYVQSRSYRAPEVILGCRYGTGVDVWSLGAMLPELATGTILFNADSVSALLASVAGVCGPIPAEMLQEGRNTVFYVSKHGAFYAYEEGQLVFHFPDEPPPPRELFGYDDPDYVGFVRQCLTLDPALRPSAAQLLDHPFLTKSYDPG
ncbi:putative protein kinase [Leptomonas pyrrhocoris]|uniref:Protein kinase domain-containing protein n=1 Tax=Leptomonas pyrrhocoris TaxID=157538 RepID=A0A0M9FY87_LEPPY|nr:putative protein kinase [Leptomonas pyrrhocoris]KPA78387.1 putative protein kinase [Leptomonas pyrrhocoris]|eukprot:XP_015656826.1 putative protein kinase [Leptomonas pyrrhocoris]